ncbi:DNA-binding protein [Halomonas maura]|uniref:DNA-binding protein n=1 Tax=Halomonas maura TaxID=117606 RepID=UPI0025B571ED|nr:DNA-binding protein [Halomonas maura]MDN3554477.1 DNA-binding protein [Halomonas maura]
MEEPQAPKVLAHVPLITIERFAELSGLEQGVVYGQIRNAHLPAVRVGKSRRVNIALLRA